MLSYLPMLDGLRGIAIILVLQDHFTAHGAFGFGGLGVRIFFVLSGFLITRILLGYTDRHVPPWAAARHFYWRRLLRLAPPLYLAIAITSLFDLQAMRENWLIHALYLTNFKVVADQFWGPASHFWSLAAEEQFYLVWFAVVVALPRSAILPAIVAGIVSAHLFRVIEYLATGDAYGIVLLPATFDFFCLGALIAYAQCRRPRWENVLARALGGPVLCAAAIVTVVNIGVMSQYPLAQMEIQAVAEALVSGCLVLFAIRAGNTGKSVAARWLAASLLWPPLRHLGRVSYGVYVYHAFIPEVLERAGLRDILADGMAGDVMLVAIQIALALVVAQASWVAIEKPIARLKDLVPEPVAPVIPAASALPPA